MKQILYKTGLMAMLILSLSVAESKAQTRIGIELRFGDRDRNVGRSYSDLCDIYRLPRGVIGEMIRAGIAAEDIPVILYIKANSHYSLRHIYSLRARGATWDQLSIWCGVRLYASDYRSRIANDTPPHGNAYGHYKKHKDKKHSKNERYYQ